MKHYTTTYAKAVSLINNMVWLNKDIREIDNNFVDQNYDILYKESENEDDEPQEIEIHQYFVTDCTEWDIEWLKRDFPSLIFGYSSLLDRYILCVDHFGMIWDGVYIKTTNKLFATECK